MVPSDYPVSSPCIDMHIVKEELFDADVMNHLSTHDGITSEMKTKLRKYKKNRRNINHVDIVYSWGKDWQQLQVGRLTGLGLQGFDKEIRSALAAKYYFDLDMVNSQPVLLKQLCRNNGWSCPILDEFVLTRPEKMELLMNELNVSRGEAKELFIQTLFGSKVGWAIHHPYLISLTKEMTIIMENTCLKYPKILQNAKRIKKLNPQATCLATVIQDEERKALLVIDRTIQKSGRQMDVLIHDGGLVRRLPNEVEFPFDIIRACEKAVKDELGYFINLQIKPLSQTIQFKGCAKKYLPCDTLVSDSFAAKKFVELIGEGIVLDNNSGRWLFDFKTGLWSQDPRTLRAYLDTYASSMIFYQVGPNGDIINDYSGHESNIKNMICNIDRHLDPIDFISLKGDSGIGKFLFEDGIYDIDTKTFTEGFDPNILFFAKISRKFAPRDETMIKKVNTLLFEDPYILVGQEEQSEQSIWFKRGIARALYGDYSRHKNCYITVGQPNCGRGLLTSALSEAFGDYVKLFSPNALVYNAGSSSDEAKKMAWVIPLVNSRLAIGNEITMAPKKFIDGNQLKSLAGGGDSVVARLNFKDDAKFVIRTTILLQANDLLPIKPADTAVMNRVVINELKKTYCTNPTNDNEMLQDASLKFTFKTEAYCAAVFHLMSDSYTEWIACGSPSEKPAALKALTSEWIENTNSIKSMIESKYEITKSEDDYVSSRELISFLKDKGCVESDTKIGRELTAIGCSSLQMKMGGITTTVRIGIRNILDGLQIE